MKNVFLCESCNKPSDTSSWIWACPVCGKDACGSCADLYLCPDCYAKYDIGILGYYIDGEDDCQRPIWKKMEIKENIEEDVKSNRKFDGMLFWGMGDDSMLLMTALERRLHEGHNWLSGMQQGIPVDSPEYKKGEEFIKDVCRDILASFGYSDIGLKWLELPYPGTLDQSTLTEAYNALHNTRCTCKPEPDDGHLHSGWCWKCDDWKKVKLKK